MQSPSTPNRAKVGLVKLDIACVNFVKLPPRQDPVKLVYQICTDAQSRPDRKRSRYIKRMTPMTLMRKTMGDGEGLQQVCKKVLAPHFHSGGPPKKYAIRPTIRNNELLKRDKVIKMVADIVGPEHPVDLSKYELLILVDVYRVSQNVCCNLTIFNQADDSLRMSAASVLSAMILRA